MGDGARGEQIEDPSTYGGLLPGMRLGRYELLVPIARGGMARVWAARLHGQRGFQKLVAIKVILPHLAEEPEFERLFLDEARIASGVHHPNVCEIYELGEDKKTLYLVMEWVSGDSFARVLRASGKTEAVDPRVVARVVADACAGVHAAHELTDDDGQALGVVHRDLSPHNILLTADGTAKVADFGVAKAYGQLHDTTSSGQLKGKIAYMAPEQIQSSDVDRRSDLFSLGCVLYEATTGQRPFRGDGDHQIMHAVLKGEVVPPSALIRSYPLDLERVVMRALASQPGARFPTAEKMRFALEEYIARGHLVTQANVAQLIRARIGEQVDRRRERIRQASTAGDGEAGWTEGAVTMTPSNQARGADRSGVQAAPGPRDAAPPTLASTIQMQRLDVLPGSTQPSQPSLVSAPLPGSTQPSQPSLVNAQRYTPPFVAALPNVASTAPSGERFVGQPLTQPAQRPTSSAPPRFAETIPLTSLNIPSPPAPPRAPSAPAQRGALHESDASESGARGTRGSYASPADPSPLQPPAGVGHYAVAIGVGILVAAVISVGAFFAWRARTPRPANDVVVTPTTPSVTASGGASETAAVAPSADITFVLMPPEATLLVDGQDLGPAVRTMPRPAVGKSSNVVARANGYEEMTILVDYFTTSPCALTLQPLPASSPSAASARGAPALERVDEPRDPPRRGSRSHPAVPTTSVPANPY